jgi:hypothetical protein
MFSPKICIGKYFLIMGNSGYILSPFHQPIVSSNPLMLFQSDYLNAGHTKPEFTLIEPGL